MTELRFHATKLEDELREQERSIRWLAGKVNDQKISVSKSLMWYIATGQRTASLEVAQACAGILGKPLFLLFESTQQNKMSRIDNSEVSAA